VCVFACFSIGSRVHQIAEYNFVKEKKTSSYVTSYLIQTRASVTSNNDRQVYFHLDRSRSDSMYIYYEILFNLDDSSMTNFKMACEPAFSVLVSVKN
jgi:hypothetical protein